MDWSIIVEKMDDIRPDMTQEGVGGRPPFKNLVVFKVLLLKHLNGVSNEQMEFLITDRLSWKRFLGMELCDKAPDQNTIWTWEELLTKNNRYEELFDIFNQKLAEMGVILLNSLKSYQSIFAKPIYQSFFSISWRFYVVKVYIAKKRLFG